MSKSIEFAVVESGSTTYVADDAYLALVGMTRDDLAPLGDAVKWHSMSLRPALYGLKRQINTLAQVEDAQVGRRLDPERLPGARCEAVVAEWSLDAPISLAGFEGLPLAVAEYVDAKICDHLYPDLSRNPDFFGAWRAKSQSSEDKEKAA